MLSKEPWLKYSSDLHIELMQLRDEGIDPSMLEPDIENIRQLPDNDPQKDILASEFYEKSKNLKPSSTYSFTEPSGLEQICATRPLPQIQLQQKRLPRATINDKILGGWMGRCAGCLLGKPFEGWRRSRIEGMLKDTNNWPFKYYSSSDVDAKIQKKYDIDVHNPAWINNVKDGMPEDDDINYTIIGLKLLETYGINFTPEAVATIWLRHLPILHTCTAERVAYRNIVSGIYPPNSALFCNPYREWIGAQIRGDIFGYITPANPQLGAELAWRDGCISHIKNGIYGEMFVAAMLATSFVTNDIKTIVNAGLCQIPEKCRLAEQIKLAIEWKKQTPNWQHAIDKIHTIYDENNQHHWCHTISNALIVTIALLYGNLDFGTSIGIAVSSGFDTDCNGATTGSILGIILGAQKLPKKWLTPLRNTLNSGVCGFNRVKISDLALRTANIVVKN